MGKVALPCSISTGDTRVYNNPKVRGRTIMSAAFSTQHSSDVIPVFREMKLTTKKANQYLCVVRKLMLRENIADNACLEALSKISDDKHRRKLRDEIDICLCACTQASIAAPLTPETCAALCLYVTYKSNIHTFSNKSFKTYITEIGQGLHLHYVIRMSPTRVRWGPKS